MNNHLLAFDFDGAIARTFKPSPQGIGINEAYSFAVQDIFGDEGTHLYKSHGTLQNRSPSELTQLLLQNGSEALLDNAFCFFEKNRNSLEGYVPQGKGVPLEWNVTNPFPVISELLVRQKLSYLLSQIGTHTEEGIVWPEPCEGFTELWDMVELLKDHDLGISTAIISSGHDGFITKCFTKWGLELPDFLVTEDDIRGKKYPSEISRRVKPGQVPLAMAHSKWMHSLGYTFDLGVAKDHRSRIIYFGDDPHKDGNMAAGRIVFGLINENWNSGRYAEVSDSFSFEDWREVAITLQANFALLQENKSFQEIFSAHIEDAECQTKRFSERI